MILLEITPADYWYLIYGAVGGIVSLILALGLLAVAIKNIRADIWTPVNNWLFSSRRERNKRIDEMLLSVESLTSSVQDIRAEVKPNGGSSLKDGVIRVEAMVVGIQKNIDYTNAKLAHLDAVSPDAIFEMDIGEDHHLNCKRVNNALCELLNAKESELLERNWITRIIQTEQKRVQEEWQNCIDNSCPMDSVQTMKLSPRKTIQVRVQATPRIRDGVLKGFFGSMVKHSD